MSTISKECCSTPAVIVNPGDYQIQGSFSKVDDLDYYTIGNSDKKVILLYDILGYHTNNFQFSDILCKLTGYQIIVPDFFRGKPWPESDLPPKDIQKLINWAGVENGYENRVSKDLTLLINHFNKSTPNNQYALIGFCWGGLMLFDALNSNQFVAGIAIHPSMLTEQNFKDLKYPILLAPTEQEKDIIPFFDLISSDVKSKSELHDFTDQVHGFAAARGDFQNSENFKRVNDLLTASQHFLTKYFK
ncbi:hypothetical protein K502DRAFT_320121 [Neoconidiobolus thromboides FSU 785]|nr:hypothetical protein K502DRAFT_320121 [Neoconidiobolus thromboides FSU 785]